MAVRRELDPSLPVRPTPTLERIDTDAALARCIADLEHARPSAVALVTACEDERPTLLDPRRARVASIALTQAGSEGGASSTVWIVEVQAIEDLGPLRSWLSGGEGDADPPYVVLHDAHRELLLLAQLDLEPRRFGSTLVAATLVAEGADGRHDRRSLADCIAQILGQRLDDDALTTESARASSLARGCDGLVPLLKQLTPTLRQRGLSRVYDLECHLLPAVLAMEDAGVGVDAARFQQIADGWGRERASATDPDRITRLDKLISTYGHWPRDFVDLDGRIHCQLHPLAADSGRFSATQPNLQQVPGEHTAPGLRGCFVPADGHVFVIADYAQIELRVAAHLAPCDALRGVFHEGRDPHRATAATLTGKPEAQVTDRERKLAKAVNFGFLFGMGPARFRSYARDSYGVELTDADARRAKESFFTTFPGIAAWHRRVGQLGRRGGEVTVKTAMGRRKRFAAERFSFNAALNIPVQGTAAEGFKLAMIELHEELPKIGGRGVLCIHDEYLAEVPKQHAEHGRELVVRSMRQAMETLVTTTPIEVDARIAGSWGEAG